jgi:hypothetical protein
MVLVIGRIRVPSPAASTIADFGEALPSRVEFLELRRRFGMESEELRELHWVTGFAPRDPCGKHHEGVLATLGHLTELLGSGRS